MRRLYARKVNVLNGIGFVGAQAIVSGKGRTDSLREKAPVPID